MNAGDFPLPHEAKPLSLKHLAASILRFLEARETTTFQEVTDRISAEVSPHGSGRVAEKTTRRRIYDVLNVFLACDLVVREGKSLRYRSADEIPSGAEPPIAPAEQGDLYDKCKQLHSKVRMLLAYETLMRRNAQSARPPSAVQLPVIVVGFKSSISGASNMSLDGKSLEIHASENPLFYSPMDVFERIPLPAADQIDALRQFPALASLEAALFA